MALGEREQVVFRGFRGIDPRRQAIYQDVFVPQEQVAEGLLLDARNLRFSSGRGYWYRNQLRIPAPAKVCAMRTSDAITAAVRAANVVTITTGAVHHLAVGNRVVISAMTDATFNGTFVITTVPSTTTFTYAQTAANATSSGGTVTPTWPTGLVEYFAEDYNQVLCFADDGCLYVLDADWSDAPTRWDYGYELFAGDSWTNPASGTGLPTDPQWAFANMHDRLIVADAGMATKMWNGTALLDIGLATPDTAVTATTDNDTGDALIAGRYSYLVTFGNADFESMPNGFAHTALIDDADFATIKASVEAEQDTWDARPATGSYLTVGGLTYTFKRVESMLGGMEDSGTVVVENSGDGELDALNAFRILAELINNGGHYDVPGTATMAPIVPNPEVTAAVVSVWGVSLKLVITARAAGENGNTLTIIGSADLDFSAATLTGGTDYCHVDLSAIPLGPAGTTYRKLYRAYSDDTTPGVRGYDYLLLTTINDNTTATYKDNTPQEQLGEPIAFDHAIPPRGSIMTFHRDRLWMAGVSMTSLSYKSVATIEAAATGAVRSGSTVTITTSADHGFNVGDEVVIAGVADTTMNGTFTILTAPADDSFTYTCAGSASTSGGGTAQVGVFTKGLSNKLFYSALDEPYYWPIMNQIAVGSSAPIVGLVTWHDQLLILKSDSVWLLTGYHEDDFRLQQIPGMTGSIGPHVATSPQRVVWSGHQGWVLWDGYQARVLLEYSPDTSFSYEPTSFRSPMLPTGEQAKYSHVAFHAGRFHFWADDYTFSWHPDSDAWEVARRVTTRVGMRPFEFSIYQSHILTFMRWGDTTTGPYYITVLDDQSRPPADSTQRNTDAEGNEDDEHFGEVRVEFPPVVAPLGEHINPIEFYFYGQWSRPRAASRDLHLFIFDEATSTWVNLGDVAPNGRLGIPAGYAKQRVRLVLYGREVPNFVLQSAGLVLTRQKGRGAG